MRVFCGCVVGTFLECCGTVVGVLWVCCECVPDANDLVEMRQSACRKNHSTETAVLGVLDNLLTQADKRLVFLVAVLDLSAACDTIDHTVLLRRLESTVGVRGTVLFFRSLLHASRAAFSQW